MNWTTEISNKEYLEFTNYYSSTTRGPKIYVIDNKEYYSYNLSNLSEDEFDLIYESVIYPILYDNNKKITIGNMDYGNPNFNRMYGFIDAVDSIEMFIYKILNLINYYSIHIVDMCWDDKEQKIIYFLWVD